IFFIVPETCVPTKTVVTGFTLPVAVTADSISPLMTLSVLNFGSFFLSLNETNAIVPIINIITITMSNFFISRKGLPLCMRLFIYVFITISLKSLLHHLCKLLVLLRGENLSHPDDAFQTVFFFFNSQGFDIAVYSPNLAFVKIGFLQFFTQFFHLSANLLV